MKHPLAPSNSTGSAGLGLTEIDKNSTLSPKNPTKADDGSSPVLLLHLKLSSVSFMMPEPLTSWLGNIGLLTRE